ncbi:MAG: hypothetical protein R6V10_03305 [bacterium]
MKRKKAANKVSCLLILVLLAGLVFGCPLKKEPEETAAEPPPLDGESLVKKAEEEGSALKHLDAKLKATLKGGSAPYQGRFFGSILMERGDTEGVNLLLQVYNMAGVPVLELVSKGRRVQVFSPLNDTVFVNFTRFASGDKMDEFPSSSFSEVSLPLEVLIEQIGLIMGKGFSQDYRYKLTERDDYYQLTEWDGDVRRREIEYNRPGLSLRRVRSYRGGILLGSMKCSKHVNGPGPLQVPSRVVLSQDEMELTLELSKLRFNKEVKGENVSFRDPQDARVILLTPPVP